MPEMSWGLSNRLNIIIVKLNFPPKTVLIAILNVFLILTDEKIFLLYVQSSFLSGQCVALCVRERSYNICYNICTNINVAVCVREKL